MKRLMKRGLSVFAVLVLVLSIATVNVIAIEYSGEAETVVEKEGSVISEVPQSISIDASEECSFNESINSELNKNIEIDNSSSIGSNHQIIVADDESYLWPVPNCRYISNYFGNGHEGIDIASNSPCDIVAARGGTVIAAQSNACSHVSARCNCNYGMGNYVQIRQNDGRYSTYMHMKKGTITVSVGQTVNQGDKIGEMGSSGNSTGQHLHYQVTETSTKRVINTNPDVFGYKLEATPKDTTPPVIERVWLDNQSGTGRMMYIEVSDNVDVSQVWCPTIGPGETNYLGKFATREPGTNIWKCAIMGEDHGSKQGEYRTDVYAYDSSQNQIGKQVNYVLDWEKPTISNIKVRDVSTLGYTVECTVSDNIGIDRVQFPTWLVNKTSPASDWRTNTVYSGSIQGNTVTYTVRDLDYNHVKGDYATHIYVYDKSGNETGDEAPVTSVKNEGKTVKEANFDNHRYLLLNDALYWTEAKKAAENMGGHLVTISSSEEQSIIQNLISGAGRSAYFIGGTDEGSEGSFRWVTGEPMLYTNWHGGNPDNWDGNENYMDMLSSGLWNDIPGNYPCGYVVEIEPVTPIEDDPLTLEYFVADKASNQVCGTSIGLSASTSGGTAPYQYKFYAKVGTNNTLIQDYSTNATATFLPGQAGSYTLFVDVKDSAGNVATKSIDNFIIYEKQVEDPDDTDPTDINCSYQTHVQNVGWQDWKTNGDMSGTSGKGLRLEGIRIKTNTSASDLGLSYATHVQNIGWQDPVDTGLMSGTSGKGLRLEAIRINLTGSKASQYDVYYRVHAENVGWLDWATNGSDSGTAGFGYRLEGIEIKVIPKGGTAPGSTNRPFVSQ